MGQKDEAGAFLRLQSKELLPHVSSECFSCYAEVMQSSVVWTVKHTDAIDTG